MARIFDRLLSLTFHTLDDGAVEPVKVPMTTSARAAWVAFYNAHAQEQADILDHDLTAAWSKLEGYAARLALVVHGIRWAAGDLGLESQTEVDKASITAGVVLSQWFGQEARRVYYALAETPEERLQRQLLDLIQRKGGRITVRELMRSNRQYRDAVQAEEQLQLLVERGLVRVERIGPLCQGGRPYSLFVIASAADANSAPHHPSNAAAAHAEGTSASGAMDTVSPSESTAADAFLESASREVPIQEQVRAWPADQRLAWEERAAIMEDDGGLPRADAERLAWEQIVKEFPEDTSREDGDVPGLP
ncbi:MAG: DUF3987 domain-containing protein [Acidobacteria bacterium]|nr:DUF3987 domain-containing protein [Acidobacteriota bacterium]